MQDLLNDIKDNLIEQILRLEKDLEIYKKFNSNEVDENISKFLQKYNETEEIDIDILETFFEKLDKNGLESLENYKQYQELVNYYKNKDIQKNSFFNSDILK